MSIDTLIVEIDAEISKLQHARALLAGTATPAAKKRGRPARDAGAAVAVKAAAAKPVKAANKGKRSLSPEARQAIADGQKKRWAKVARLKKAAAKAALPAKTASVKTSAKAAKKAPARPAAKPAVKPVKNAPVKGSPAKKVPVKKVAVKKAPAKKIAEVAVATPSVVAEPSAPQK